MFHPPSLPQIGSEWDGKESIFRNHGGILGVWDEPVANVHLNYAPKGSIKIVWYDAIGAMLSSHSVTIEGNLFTTTHRPKLSHPMRPGVWTVKVEAQGNGGHLLMHVKFLVVPLTHSNMRVMESPQDVNARKIEPIGGKKSSAFREWSMNVTKYGTALEEWVDFLVAKHWRLEGYCAGIVEERVEGGGGSPCTWLPDCSSTAWSTLSPDPKSEIPPLTKVGLDGRIR